MQTIAAFLQQLADWSQLGLNELLWMGLAVLAAGVVRGFAGFGLGAFIVTSLAPLLPPVVLMPICLLLEVVVSGFTLRGSWHQANFPTVRLLALGMAVGLPLGLLTTTQVSVEVSKLGALLVVALLAGAQLLGSQARVFLGHYFPERYAPHASGVLAGFVSGVAGAGGMVSALYFLASRMPASTIRASLMLNLMVSIFTTSVFYTLFGLLNALAVKRAVVLLPLALIGLRLGMALFRPRLTPYYRQFCLGLLLLLSLAGLSRLV